MEVLHCKELRLVSKGRRQASPGYLFFKTDVDTPRTAVHVTIILECLDNNLVVKLVSQALLHMIH